MRRALAPALSLAPELSLALALSVAILAVASHAGWAQDTTAQQKELLGECRQDSPAEKRLSACAQIIKAKKVKGDTLAFAYLQLGLAKAEGGALEAAIKDFDQAIRLSPKATDVLYNRGAANTQLGRWQAALADFDQLLGIAPKDADALYMRAWVHSQTGDDEAAIKDLDAVLALYPDDQPALYDRAGLLLRAGRPNDAAKAYSRLLELDPKSAAAAFNRGRAYSMLGSHGKAARDFGQVLTLAPGNPYAALRLHLAEMRSGAGAGKALEAALGALGKEEWPSQLLLVYLGRAKGEDVLAALAQVPDQDRARIQCEANYYLGALADAKGETKAARALYQAAVKTGAGASVEFIDAGLALAAR